MIFDVLTLFPEMFFPVLGESIIGRAQENKIIEVNLINIRDYSKDKHKKVDDSPYGGGTGMVMTVQPIYDAYRTIVKNINYKPHVVYMSPQGKVLDQDKIKKLKELEHIVILCGHYEGIDERIIEEIVDEEISIGDYVLTGGELPAMVLIDCISRTLPGVLAGEEAYMEESHFNGLLEYPQYTRPYNFLGKEVPEVLISGHHANIEKWRRQQALVRTYLKRPDLFEKLMLNEEDKKLLEEGLGTGDKINEFQ
ncbi:MAG TPA: tRNA (guanosine(37)-N1)-methyltransferase TrmD [Clostridiaceae bacterium]|nr:tRNA (guanosine(37)-N1)-methyltransferase TrmD [Clostridiaceae bacterium]